MMGVAQRCGKGALCVASVFALAACAHKPIARPATAGAAPAAGRATAAPKSDRRYAQDKDSQPTGAMPDISKILEPIPKREAPSVYGNKSPYDVLGHTYRVLPSATGYVERGIASWYGNKFHGYTTSNFEKYDMYAFTAAHKTLPLPSYARVTNLDNGASVVVRINDRGPFAENRIIDLSYVAAIKLGVWQKGTGMVEVRAIDADHPDVDPKARPLPEQRSANAAPTAPARTQLAHADSARVSTAHVSSHAKPRLFLQIGAYSDHANAERAASRVRASKLGEVQVIASKASGRSVERVRVGPLNDVNEADALTPKLRALGLGEPRVAIDP